jgi:predicted nucleic acid-binding protein
MSANVFVDTNILVYSRDLSEPVKQVIAIDRLKELWQTRTGKISTQVCNEYYTTVTQKLKPGLSKDTAWQDIEDLFAWQPLAVDKKVLIKAKACQLRYKLSWWDSLIVSAAYYCNCETILSEDLNNSQKYFDIAVENPFSI